MPDNLPPESDDVLLNDIVALDTAGDLNGIAARIADRSRDPNSIAYIVYQLLTTFHLQAAYAIARIPAIAQLPQPVLYLARALGGLLNGNPADEAQGNALLARIIDALPVERRLLFYRQILQPLFFRLIGNAYAAGSHDAILRLTEIMKAGVPELRTIFDWTAPAQPFNPIAAAARGRAKAHLLNQALPPAGSPREKRKVLVAVRQFIFPGDPRSKVFDLGERMLTALRLYGWEPELLYLGFLDLHADYMSIIGRCAQLQPDVLILDDGPIQHEHNLVLRDQLIAHFRANHAALKLVSLHMDSWEIRPELLIRASTPVDAVWATTPSLAVWSDPVLNGKIMQAPLPHGGHANEPAKPLPQRMAFIGAVKGYNWHRLLWNLGATRNHLPIDWQLSSMQADGLSPSESYAGYMRRLADSGCALNFSMRPDLSLVITDRSFEAPLVGALLVQEQSADLDHFFVSGEHYLEFSSFADLRAIGDFLVANPAAADQIRRNGNAFAQARYSDPVLIGYLDKILFHPA